MSAYTLYLFGVWTLLGFVRISGGLKGTIPSEYFRVGQGPRPADRIVDIHHHFSNQFEIPILFYLGCVVVLVTDSVDPVAIALAWAFVALRLLHTAVILVRNDPRLRVTPYVLSSLVVWAIWLRIFLEVVVPERSG